MINVVAKFRYLDTFPIVGRGPVFSGKVVEGSAAKVTPGMFVEVGHARRKIVGVERMGKSNKIGLLVKHEPDKEKPVEGAVYEILEEQDV